MNTFLKNTAILAVGLLSVLSSCSGDFLDNKPTDAVDSGIVPVPSMPDVSSTVHGITCLSTAVRMPISAIVP